MIKPLRTYHFFIWRILAVSLPILFVLAIWLRPNSYTDYTWVGKDFSFDLQRLTDSTSQINIDVKNALRTPPCVVYASIASHEILLGKVDHQGKYNFQIERRNEQGVTLRLYDALHKKEIANILLTENKP